VAHAQHPEAAVSARAWRGPVVVALACAAGVAAACDRSDARTPEPAGDATAAELRTALAALPPALAAPLAVAPALADAAIARTAGAECAVLDTSTAAGVRRRVRTSLADSSRLVVYVRAAERARADERDAAWTVFERGLATDTGGLARVELVRRAPDGTQIGFVWDAPRGRASVVRWPAEGGYRAEESLHPRNSPLAPALRAAGRRVLALRCPAQGPAAPRLAPAARGG
jgi:hypothetical protein